MSEEHLTGPHDDYPEVHATRRPRADGQRTRTLVLVHDGAAGNWSWHRQVEAMSDYRILTPSLPGYGGRRAEEWQGIESAAEDLAAFIAERVDSGRVHLAGMGLGALVSLHVMARHAELLDAVVLSGAPVVPASPTARRAAAVRNRMPGAQRVSKQRAGGQWFATVQAGAYGALEPLVGDAAAPATARAVAQDCAAVAIPEELEAYRGDALLVAGAKEPRHIHRGLLRLAEEIDGAEAAIVPVVHHAWNLEEPVFFNAVLRRWLEQRERHPRLGGVAGAG